MACPCICGVARNAPRLCDALQAHPPHAQVQARLARQLGGPPPLRMPPRSADRSRRGATARRPSPPARRHESPAHATPTYGGPCPRTPFDMSRRFIPLARSAADPEAIIRERFKRISRDALVAHASTDALRRAHHEAMGVAGHMEPPSTWRAEAQRRRQHEGGLTSA